MTSTPRRSGFRLPWSIDGDADDKTDATATPETPDASTATAAPAPAVSPVDAPADAVAPTAKAPKPDSQPAVAETAPTSGVTPSDPFLQNLVDAMRHVAEEARDRNIGDLRTLVEKRVAQIGERGTERAEDLQRRSELDIKGIGDWERSELDRVKTEAQRKVEARRKELEQQLREHQQNSETEVEAVRARLADHERELGAFFAQLAEIKDPAAFVAAAKRMPAAPSLDVGGTTASVRATASTQPESLTSRLEMLGIDKQQVAGASANGMSSPQPDPAEATLEERLAQLDEQLQPSADATPATPGAADANGEVSTAIVVKGLGSFGAITSFKQSLEKVEGIRSVTLSLGPTGEFVYRAAHDAAFDLEAVIGTLEGGSAELERQSDGTLRVTVNRSR